MSANLTPEQRQIMERLAREPGDGHMTAEWIAEGCGHFYDTPWASARLTSLIRRGLVSSPSRGWYEITDAGRQAALPPVQNRSTVTGSGTNQKDRP